MTKVIEVEEVEEEKVKKKSQKYIIEGRILFLEGGEARYNLNDVPEALHETILMHGFKQKLVDKCSSLRKQLGRPLETLDYEQAMTETYEHLLEGNWTSRKVKEQKTDLELFAIALRKKVSAGIMTEKEFEKNVEFMSAALA